MIPAKSILICLLMAAATISTEGCKKEEVPVDDSGAIARAEKAERELAKTREALQLAIQDKELAASAGANTSDQVSQINGQLQEALEAQQQLLQTVKNAEAERDQALVETREAQELAAELEKYLQESERRVAALEKTNKELEALADELANQVSILSEHSDESNDPNLE